MGLEKEKTKHDYESNLLERFEDAEKGIRAINSFDSIEELQRFIKLAQEDLAEQGIQIAGHEPSMPERLVISFNKFGTSG